MVEVGTGTAASKYVKTDYPVVEGLEAGTNKHPEEFALKPEESVVRENDRVGL